LRRLVVEVQVDAHRAVGDLIARDRRSIEAPAVHRDADTAEGVVRDESAVGGGVVYRLLAAREDAIPDDRTLRTFDVDHAILEVEALHRRIGPIDGHTPDNGDIVVGLKRNV
jgi:hypothetical protein